MSFPLLVGNNIVKSYIDAQRDVNILQGVDIAIYSGETLAIAGASGSGKSTLLHILGTLDTPSSGDVLFKNKSLLRLSKTQQAKFRNSELGFVYQFHHLLPEFSATENVAMPKLIAGVSKKEANKSAHQLLERVGLSHRLSHKPHQLSGGERQRVAIARAMVNHPSIIMADEPTGNLDNEASNEILSLINDINTLDNTSFIIVTHDQLLAEKMDRTLTLVNGNFVPQ
jgi:lipoprotein-releasing system ATP-binding protein